MKLLIYVCLVAYISATPQNDDIDNILKYLENNFGLELSPSHEHPKEDFSPLVVQQNIDSNAYQDKEKDCPPGTVLNVDGSCTEPFIERRVFVFSSPNDQRRQRFPAVPARTSPKVDYNVILINKEDAKTKDPEDIDPVLSDIGVGLHQSQTTLGSIPSRAVFAYPHYGNLFNNRQIIPLNQLLYLVNANQRPYFLNPYLNSNFNLNQLNNLNTRGINQGGLRAFNYRRFVPNQIRYPFFSSGYTLPLDNPSKKTVSSDNTDNDNISVSSEETSNVNEANAQSSEVSEKSEEILKSLHEASEEVVDDSQDSLSQAPSNKNFLILSPYSRSNFNRITSSGVSSTALLNNPRSAAVIQRLHPGLSLASAKKNPELKQRAPLKLPSAIPVNNVGIKQRAPLKLPSAIPVNNVGIKQRNPLNLSPNIPINTGTIKSKVPVDLSSGVFVNAKVLKPLLSSGESLPSHNKVVEMVSKLVNKGGTKSSPRKQSTASGSTRLTRPSTPKSGSGILPKPVNKPNTKAVATKQSVVSRSRTRTSNRSSLKIQDAALKPKSKTQPSILEPVTRPIYKQVFTTGKIGHPTNGRTEKLNTNVGHTEVVKDKTFSSQNKKKQIPVPLPITRDTIEIKNTRTSTKSIQASKNKKPKPIQITRQLVPSSTRDPQATTTKAPLLNNKGITTQTSERESLSQAGRQQSNKKNKSLSRIVGRIRVQNAGSRGSDRPSSKTLKEATIESQQEKLKEQLASIRNAEKSSRNKEATSSSLPSSDDRPKTRAKKGPTTFFSSDELGRNKESFIKINFGEVKESPSIYVDLSQDDKNKPKAKN